MSPVVTVAYMRHFQTCRLVGASIPFAGDVASLEEGTVVGHTAQLQTIHFLRLEALSNIRSSARLLQRLLIGHATDVELDANGRVLVPQMLRDYADLEKKLVVLGQGNKIEIWSDERWQSRMESWLGEGLDSTFEDLSDVEDLSV